MLSGKIGDCPTLNIGILALWRVVVRIRGRDLGLLIRIHIILAWHFGMKYTLPTTQPPNPHGGGGGCRVAFI